jgi:hypothetical protein
MLFGRARVLSYRFLARSRRRTGKDTSRGRRADPKLKTQLVDLGGIILDGSSADFRTLITEETEKWAKVIRAANIKPE